MVKNVVDTFEDAVKSVKRLDCRTQVGYVQYRGTVLDENGPCRKMSLFLTKFSWHISYSRDSMVEGNAKIRLVEYDTHCTKGTYHPKDGGQVIRRLKPKKRTEPDDPYVALS